MLFKVITVVSWYRPVSLTVNIKGELRRYSSANARQISDSGRLAVYYKPLPNKSKIKGKLQLPAKSHGRMMI